MEGVFWKRRNKRARKRTAGQNFLHPRSVEADTDGLTCGDKLSNRFLDVLVQLRMQSKISNELQLIVDVPSSLVNGRDGRDYLTHDDAVDDGTCNHSETNVNDFTWAERRHVSKPNCGKNR